ncbi:uncharacterized protein BDR25DRAFT_365108 [Lindgomyces ingoldianus]|uniref:Uncharacterized protein n=1 Tax=Lindgomyces ingoldianus TaxID=673940 RepID=A0ACB6RG35_9PLEO|nr:uncharacterized protein BDR25DRAFT_365108 [Lindgomyces ingoldianus]KAF2478082.1 hypothetical protein BDR25DRAFT_365108 [Lindgomyces ingoldianus]
MAGPWYVDVAENPNIHRDAPPPPPIPAAGAPPPYALPPGVITFGRPDPPPPLAPAQAQPWPIPIALGAPPAPVMLGVPAPPPPPPLAAGVFCAGPPAYAPGGFLWGGPAPAPAPAPAPCAAPALPDAGLHSHVTFGPIPADQTNPVNLPGGLVSGVSHFFSDSYTILGWLKSGFRPWERNFAVMNIEWIQVDSNWKVDQLIKAMRENGDCEGWAVTECMERGNGVWERGTTFVHGSERSGQSLATVGWTMRRNRDDGTGALHVCLWRQ